MSIFVMFALITFFLFMVAALTRPEENESLVTSLRAWLRRRLFTFALSNEAIWLLSTGFVLIIWTVAISRLFFHEFYNPNGPLLTYNEFITSKPVASAVFGSIFGVFFGYWLRNILFRPAHESFVFKDVVISLVMLAFLVLGTGGQSVVQGVLDRLNSFELPGGAKFAFSERKENAPASVSTATQIASPSTQKEQPGSTGNGLALLADLENQIGRDNEYLKYIFKDDLPSNNSNKYITERLTPIAKCLLKYIKDTGDSSRIYSFVTELAGRIRISLLNKNLQELGNFSFDDERNQQTSSGSAGFTQECVRTLFSNVFQNLVATDYPRDQPYLWIADADLFAAGRQYVAALTSLDDWARRLNAAAPPSESGGGIEADKISAARRIVYEIRVRSLITIFVEEWKRSSDAGKATVVNEYQLRNIFRLINVLSQQEKVRDTLDSMSEPKSIMLESHYKASPEDDVACPEAADHIQPTLQLVRVLLSQKMLWVTTALEHPDYTQRFAAIARRLTTELTQVNLSCFLLLVQDKASDLRAGLIEQSAIMRAEILNLVAKVELADHTRSAHLAALADPEQARSRLRDALSAVELAISLMIPLKDDELGKDTGNTDKLHFPDQVSAAPAVETYEELLKTREALERALH